MNVLLKRRPSGPLAAHIEALWVKSPPPGVDTLVRLPTTRSHVAWEIPGRGCEVRAGDDDAPQRLEGPLLCTAHETIQRVTFLGKGPRLFVGAAFTPGGLRAFMRTSPGELRCPVLPLSDVWGEAVVLDATRQLMEAMKHSMMEALATLEALFQEQLRVAPESDRPVQRALATLDAEWPDDVIQEAARRLEMNERQFREVVRDGTGLTPKRYARLLRFARALRGLHRQVTTTHTALAAECGYFDQAHFNHEFKALSGMTPSDYRRDHRDSRHGGCPFVALRERVASSLGWR